ncbi:2-formylbenzoate dehydrogenase [Amycolatopsis sacchari]|uniref:2-formylbenzoate dehydrogenase n=2 Tax=Amycolatopsis sacchari TaxID=115433 RepID=A0A1I4B9X7_9PSEU|nr:aldehyde dehydrogenase family protein [Amycolatopsis sacchari]SFK65594.1 2-formylbenzoate dehydrogenase [Amycolatopsis sacchari]
MSIGTVHDAEPATLASNEARVRGLLDREWRLLVDGRRVGAASGKTFPVTSPYTEEVIAHVPDASAEDVDRAIAGAARAFPAWARTTPGERAKALFALADEIERRAQDFAVLDAIDGGAPVGIMLLDVKIALDSLRYFAGLAMETKGYTVPASTNLHFTELQPYGVVGKIIPFNHPFMFAASKIAAPLAAGNTVVLKPAEATPLSALLLADLVQEILPPGVVQVVVGDGPEAPQAIVRSRLVRRIGFTGSEQVGRFIQRSAAEVAVKHVTLELGGKNALIAFPDASPQKVARAAIQGMNFTWSGQSCGSTSRLLVHDDIADEVLAAVAAQLAGRRFVSPLDPEAVQGTMVNKRQYDRVLGYLAGAVDSGARVVTGGGRPASVDKGLFVAPTFLDRVSPEWPVANEEIFGPVVSVIRWTDEEDAVRIANSVDYGLTGSVFTNDISTAHRVARALETGFVWINGAGPHFQGVPYGGWKNSGVGREESLEELLSYTQSKSVTVML